MTRFICLIVAAVAAPAHASPAHEPIVGCYLADGKDHQIELFLRENVLHGRITWIKDAALTDKENADPKLRRRPVAGIEHIRGFTKSRDGNWTGGTLHNPQDGRTYEAKVWIDSDNRLVIEGRPNVPVLGGILGALFGRISYSREGAP